MSVPDHSVLDAALAALDRGFCPIPCRIDGTKRPIGKWEHWQSELPSIEQVHAWFDDGHPGLGVVGGAVSGGLEFLEFESAAIALVPEFRERLAAAGLGELFQRVGKGYFENSPGGGLHIAYRIDGEVPGNTKLAARRMTDGTVQTLIETRGEGGFMVVAPSHGPTHGSGQPYVLRAGGWDSVVTISKAQRDALLAVAESFDEMPPVPPPTPRRLSLVRGDSWIDATLAEWSRGNPIETVLARHGWTYLESDTLGQLWRRPGKERGSCSGRVNESGRLHVFSTSTPFRAGGKGATTYDALDVELTYGTGRVPSADDRTAALRIIGAQLGTYTPTTGFEFVGNGHVEPASEPSGFGLLPDEFWAARPMLGYVRQAAHARGLAPDAVLLAFLTRYATTIPTTLMLPAVVGAPATFDLIGVLVSPSGGGKTSAMSVAKDLFDVEYGERLLFDPPIGSGEGLVQAFLKIETVKIDGEKVQQQVQVLDGLHIGVDEGTVLRAQMGREGTIVAQTLCSAWSGTSLGQLNARTDTRRIIPAHHARLTAVMGMQTAHGEFLVSGAAADMGLTQRLIFASQVDPRIPFPPPEFPRRIDVPQASPHHQTVRAPIAVVDSVAAEIIDRHYGLVTGRLSIDPLDAHQYLNRLKVAGVLMFLDARRQINDEDWALAGMIMATSVAVRSTILETAKLRRLDTVQAVGQRQAAIKNIVRSSEQERAMKAGARAIARRVRRESEPQTRKQLRYAVGSIDRRNGGMDEIIEYAIASHWVVEIDGRYGPGDSMPE